MSIGQTIVPYSAFQAAFQANPDQMHTAVQTATATAASGDPAQQQQFLTDWNKAIDILSKDAKPVLKKGDKGRAILHTPKDALASAPANASREAGDGRRQRGNGATGADNRTS